MSAAGARKLIFSCSGAADVGEIADRAARKLTCEGAGKMFCLAGIGGRVASIVKIAKAAETILAVDGCAQTCASHCLRKAGITRFARLQLADIGMEKGMSPATDDAIARVAAAARGLLRTV